VVLDVFLQMLGQVIDALGQQGNLHVGRPCVALMQLEPCYRLSFFHTSLLDQHLAQLRSDAAGCKVLFFRSFHLAGVNGVGVGSSFGMGRGSQTNRSHDERDMASREIGSIFFNHPRAFNGLRNITVQKRTHAKPLATAGSGERKINLRLTCLKGVLRCGGLDLIGICPATWPAIYFEAT
jgi:hypothetical protein